MKKALNSVGFGAAFLLCATVVMKSNHLPGAGIVMALAGLAISIYLPLFILYKDRSTAKAVGAASASLINLGITFKFQHWPGAGPMLVLGLTSFALICIPMLLKEKQAEGGTERKTLMNTAGATGLTLFSLGLLFKIMHWPGASVMLGLSVLFLFFGYFLLYLLDKSIDSEVKAAYLRKAFFSVIIGSIVATCILLDLSRPWSKAPQPQAMVEGNH
ncbi:MAG: gliding motility-associated protein GldL [Bacteroidetes bacterium]|nr:gliding motility-associated protein GldL [Bacteroidota bacterium]